jgi:hypothetical protein
VGRALTALAIVVFGALASLFALSITRSSDARPVPAIEVADLGRAGERSAKRPKPERVRHERARSKATARKNATTTRVAADPSPAAPRAVPAQGTPKVSDAGGRSRAAPRPTSRGRGAPLVSIAPVPISPIAAAEGETDTNVGDDVGNDDSGEPGGQEPNVDGD